MNDPSFSGHNDAPGGSDDARGFDPSRGTDQPSDFDTSSPSSSFGAGLDDAGATGDAPKRKTARRRTTRKKTTRSRSTATEVSDAPSGDEPEAAVREASGDFEAGKAPSRRRSRARTRGADADGAKDTADADTEPAPRRTRSRSRSRASEASFDAADADEAAAEPARERAPEGEGDDAGPRRRRRGSRGGRRKRCSSSAPLDGPEDESTSEFGDSNAGASDQDSSPESGRRSRRTKSRDADRGAEQDLDRDSDRDSDRDDDARAESDGAEGATKPKRRARRPRRRSKSEDSGEREGDGPELSAGDDERSTRSDDDDADSEEKPKRRRGTRGGRRRSKSSGPARAVEVEAIPGEFDELSELSELPADAELVEEPASERSSRTKRRRKKSSKLAGESVEDDDPPRSRLPEVKRDQVILVNAINSNETRVAVVGDNKIVDLQMNVHEQRSLVNDIYRGRVVNLESAIGAAFVDFGQGRNGFLHASDVLEAYGEKDWRLEKLLTARVADDELDDTLQAELATDDDDEEEAGSKSGGKKKGRKASKRAPKGKLAGSKSSGGNRRRPRLPIGDLLQKGQLVVAQITKDAIGDKGPTLTTYISIPGRYLVLMPSLARTGVSRKIEDDRERRRLKRILSALDIPDGMGVIVRTAGIGKTKTELRRDLESLLASWNTFAKRLVLGRNPMPLYQESDVAIRTMRDLFSARTSKVIVDDQGVYDRMVDFTRVLMPEHLDRIELHEAPRPLFHAHGIEQDFERIFSRRVELPSGGSIVIDQTEALVAIDVNSGRTRDEGAGFEDIALKTNLEAAPEIARQMRLRDLGGIIVLDFIDMLRSGNRRLVERSVRDHLATDRARSKIGRISQFGLLEMTRQRLGPGLSKLLYDACLRCRGTGRQRTAESRGQALLRRLGSALTLKGFTTVEISAHPETIEYLEQKCSPELKRLRDESKRELRFKSAPEQLEDSVLHYLRADGREVRPGGRRKR